MSNYPPEVQAKLDLLQRYTLNDELTEFNILHLYPQGLAYPNGFYDSQYFKLVGYNTLVMQYRVLAEHRDGLRFYQDTWGKAVLNPILIENIGIYLDGSTYIGFKNPVCLLMHQNPSVFDAASAPDYAKATGR